MADYQFDTQIVADPVTFQRAANATVTVYDINDATNATPLALKDLNGLPITNPLHSTAEAFIPPFVTSSPQVKLVGGGLTVPGVSFKSFLDEAKAAQTAAAASAADAASAASWVTALTTGVVDGGNASTNFSTNYTFDGGTANG